MQTFRVVWEIDVETDTAEEAALEASQMMLDVDTTATIFKVTGADGQTKEIDINEL